MAAIAAFFSSVWLALVIFCSEVAAVLRLLGLALMALIAGKGKAGAIAAVTSSGGLKLDVPQQLSLPVATALVTDYFGLNGANEAQLIHWASIMFQYLFIDLADDPKVTAAATVAAAECRAFLDAAVQNRKQNPGPPDDILSRCLALRTAGFPGMTDSDIRNNLIGMVIGAIPTTTIARGTCRARTIPEVCMVFASNLSAMFDPLAVASPGEFRAGRPAADYILWGAGLHTCFGGHINFVSIPGLLKPLLARPGLRRAEGAAGKIDTAGTPFPVHFWVDFS